ncbi:hypothetical protein O181_011054 [Austropuccinia psidii MF-1]|uniref:aspartate kinase n=1 Tax=Austropuccinia psidii MF-1 TaxID=1389203 RepID=A0A9Q3GLH3_9BASI|nr:hypothetical protein [Austropuccinia psidii MF-1]
MPSSVSITNNLDSSSWLIQKYGGTSLGKFLLNIPQKTLPDALSSGRKVVIVCSARSGQSKSTGTTNLLLQAALEAIQPNPNIKNSPDAFNLNHSNHSSINPSVLSQILSRGSTPKLLSRSNSTANGLTSPTFPSSTPSSPPYSKHLNLNSISTSNLTQLEHSATSRFNHTIELIKSDHLRAANEIIRNQDVLSELEQDISFDCDRLKSLLLATQILDDISPKSKDLIVAVGERLSSRLVTACLIDQGFRAEFICLDNIVNKSDFESIDLDPSDALRDHGGQLRQPFYDLLASKLAQRLRQCQDRIPVVTGFFGVVPGSLLAQVGRGYTDLCAALCAVGLGAVELEIWKEVDGIFTADPRKVPKAKLLSVVTPEEAAELTYYGSEVIHPFTMEQVIRASIPIRIKNIMNPTGPGTVIYPNQSIPPSPCDLDLELPTNHNLKAPTAVTIKEDIIVLNIHSNRKTISHGFFARIFGILDKFGIIVDLISTSEVHVSMAIMLSERDRLNGLDRLERELKDIGNVSVMNDMAILSLVGRKMKNMVGIAGKMFSTLAAGNVNIEMISQGASEINISCVISNQDSSKALKLVHDTLVIGSSIENRSE